MRPIRLALVTVLVCATVDARPQQSSEQRKAEKPKYTIQTFTVYGLGSYSCGDFNKMRQQKTVEETAGYSAYISWMHGYVTGAGEQVSTSHAIWDAFVRTADNDVVDARREYCVRTPRDPICRIWASTQTRPDAVFLKTTQNGLNSWLEKDCGEHPLKQFSHAASALVIELTRENQPK